MFTGIVQHQCEVVAVADDGGVRRLTVELGDAADGLKQGASVATNGVCLTATDIDGSTVAFDVIAETLTVSNLGEVAVGDRVNIERSLTFGDELGGHILSGHVAGVATVDAIEADGTNRTMWFRVDPDHLRYLLWKGWVALDGASLTISRVDRPGGRIAVSLIPETLARTTLGRVAVGDTVNLEIDAQTQAIIHGVHEVLSDPELRGQILDLT